MQGRMGVWRGFQEWLVHVYSMVRNCSSLGFECRLLFISLQLCQRMTLAALELELKLWASWRLSFMTPRCNKTLWSLRASEAMHKNSPSPSQVPPHSLASIPTETGIFRLEKKWLGGTWERFLSLWVALEQGWGRLCCLLLHKTRQHYMKLVGARLKSRQKMALQATSRKSVHLLTKRCCGYEKFTWIQGEFTE